MDGTGGIRLDGKLGYKRNFLIFEQEDQGYGAGKNPSGFVKVEVRDGRGKLHCSVQNLKEDTARYLYRLYLISSTARGFLMADMGVIPLKKGSVELKLDFDPRSVGDTGSGINSFNIYAVLLEHRDKNSLRIICPLAAYTEGKTEWRSKAGDRLKALAAKAAATPLRTAGGGNLPGTASIESKYSPEEASPDFNIPVSAREKSRLPATPEEEQKQPLPGGEEGTLQTEPAVLPEKEGEDPAIPGKYSGQPGEEQLNQPYLSAQEAIIQMEMELKDVLPEGAIPEIPEGYPEKYEEKQPTRSSISAQEDAIQKESEDDRLEDDGEEPAIPGKYPDPPSDESPGETPQGGDSRSASPIEDASRHKTGSDIERLRAALDKFFERYEPFRSRRKDYLWWKVNSPVNLNNVLYQCNIKTPLLFNPALMMAHFKYRHLITGIYTDREKGVDYIVCGVPGVHNIDNKPFGELCRWAQLEGTRPRYGAFGYWLVYIDPQTGKFLNVR